MPRRKIDNSPALLAFDREPWKPISSEAVLRVANTFGIEDRDTFSKTVHDWSCNYGSLRKMFRDIPSRADQRDIYHDIAKKLEAASNALGALGPALKMKLSLSIGNRDMPEEVRNAVATMMRNESHSVPGKPFPSSYDVNLVRDEIDMIKSVSDFLATSIDQQLKQGAPSLSPERNMDIELLASSIRAYFKTTFPQEPTGRNFDPAGIEGPAGQTPLNRYSAFTVECVRLIEPEISQSRIQDSMAKIIQRENEER